MPTPFMRYLSQGRASPACPSSRHTPAFSPIKNRETTVLANHGHKTPPRVALPPPSWVTGVPPSFHMPPPDSPVAGETLMGRLCPIHNKPLPPSPAQLGPAATWPPPESTPLPPLNAGADTDWQQTLRNNSPGPPRGPCDEANWSWEEPIHAGPLHTDKQGGETAGWWPKMAIRYTMGPNAGRISS